MAMVLGAWLAWLPLAPVLDLQLYDLGLRERARQLEHGADDQVVVVLDTDSLDALPVPLALLHAELARFLQAMAAAGAKAVVIDLILPERSWDTVQPGLDAQLVRALLAMRQAGVLVLARTVDESGRPRRLHAPLLAAAGPGGSGLAVFRADTDGVVRRFTEHLAADGTAVDTLVGVLARRLGMAVGEGRIDYALHSPPPTIALRQVLAWERDGQHTAMSNAFAGRVVWLGAALPFDDRHRTPLQHDAGTPGVLIHLQTLRTLREGRSIRELPAGAVLALGAAAGAVFALAGSAATAVASAAMVLLLAAAGGWVLLAQGWAAPLASLALVGSGAALARWMLDTGLEARERRRLRRAFAGYVSPEVLKVVERGGDRELAGVRRFICVLFVDVRGFTTRVERQAPEEVIAVLNELFELATSAVHRRGGTVKEFMGDGVMAFFGAPATLSDPVRAAFDAAVEIHAGLPSINRRLSDAGHQALAIGMGLACGEAVVGNIGAAARHAYGALGDCVNLASRLQGLSEPLQMPLLMSDEVRAALGEVDGLVELGLQAIKGHRPVLVHGWRAVA